MTRENTELAGAIERVDRWANYEFTTADQIAVRSEASTFTAGDLQLILSALSAAPLHEGEGEPVAWRFWHEGGWNYSATDPSPHLADCVEREPLYAAPPPSVEVERLREALTPSGDTKAAYSGEFKFQVTQWRESEDPDAEEEIEEYLADFTVPWTTIKEIMAAIATRAALSRKQEPGAPGGEGE